MAVYVWAARLRSTSADQATPGTGARVDPVLPIRREPVGIRAVAFDEQRTGHPWPPAAGLGAQHLLFALQSLRRQIAQVHAHSAEELRDLLGTAAPDEGRGHRVNLAVVVLAAVHSERVQRQVLDQVRDAAPGQALVRSPDAEHQSGQHLVAGLRPEDGHPVHA